MRSVAHIEKLIDLMERQLAIATYVAPRHVRLIADPSKRETAESVIAAHIKAKSAAANCDFIVRVLCDGGNAHLLPDRNR